MMLTDTQANSLVRGLIFAVQKTRSDITESVGSDAAAQELLADIHPLVFGDQSILPRLIQWQEHCKRSGVIAGVDLFNFVKYIDLKASPVLGLLPAYGYPSVPLDGPPIEWFTQTWPYLTDGY